MLVVRQETPSDYSVVYEVVKSAFGKSAEADLVKRLRLVNHHISLVAAQDGEILGHIMFSPIMLKREDGEPHPIQLAGLAPVSVRPDRQKQGVGGKLIRAGLEVCQAAGYAGCFLIGHPEYYPRFGFQPAQSTFSIDSTYEVPDPVFMGKELVEGALCGLTGTVHYHPTFQGV